MTKKKLFQFKSIYQKFAVIFICLWWVLNSITFTVLFHIVTKSRIIEFAQRHPAVKSGLGDMKFKLGVTFFIVACIGTLVILLVVRQVVKPIRTLSVATREVAKGNFDITLRSDSIDEIGQLTNEFNTMVTKLRSMDTLRKDFVSNVSHEFRTPMTSLKGFALLLRENNVSDEQRKEYSDIMIKESERLIALSNDLLWISELDNRIVPKEAETFLLDEQIRKVVLFLEPQWSKKNLSFHIDMGETHFTGQKDLLWQVWLNLIQNAIKFSDEGEEISLRIEKGEKTIAVQVQDNGVGMTKEAVGRIFERFYKEDKARTVEGNGLGLVICKKIVELCGGEIAVKSEKNKGSTFSVILPFAT